jgi:hypothetical protein
MSNIDKVTKSDTLKKKLLEALEQSLGIVTDACKMAELSRQSHYRWLKDDELYREAVEAIQDMALDFAESSLYQQIREKNTPATIFYLKTKGKHRGYIERTEIDLGVKTNNLPDWMDESES